MQHQITLPGQLSSDPCVLTCQMDSYKCVLLWFLDIWLCDLRVASNIKNL